MPQYQQKSQRQELNSQIYFFHEGTFMPTCSLLATIFTLTGINYSGKLVCYSWLGYLLGGGNLTSSGRGKKILQFDHFLLEQNAIFLQIATQ